MAFEIQIRDMDEDPAWSVMELMVFTQNAEALISMLSENSWQSFLGVIPAYAEKESK